MNEYHWARWSAIAEITSSIAVLATLIYLTVQIEQNTRATQSQSRQAVLESAQNEIFMRIQYPEIDRALAQTEIPTEDEQLKINSWLVGVLRGREFSWLQYMNGVIDEAQWNTELTVISIVLSTPRARQWWEKVGRGSFSEGFVDFVDETIKDEPPNVDFWKSLGNWAER
jgi:hypothetical protein